MKVLDLFSGIGGFSLGLERAGMETVAFCEIEKFPQKVLRKNWPDVPIYDDIKTLTSERLNQDGIRTIDVICGGFPCQDLSVCVKGAGIERGERSSLWAEMLRTIGEIRPQYVIIENVTNLLFGEKGRWFSRFLSDLASIGYDAEWHCFPAPYVGAIHHRDRVYVVANPNGKRRNSLAENIKNEYTRINFKDSNARWAGENNIFFPMAGHFTNPRSGVLRVDDGISQGMDGLKSAGNAVVPQIPEIIGRAIMSNEGLL